MSSTKCHHLLKLYIFILSSLAVDFLALCLLPHGHMMAAMIPCIISVFKTETRGERMEPDACVPVDGKEQTFSESPYFMSFTKNECHDHGDF